MIYLDWNATAPLRECARQAWLTAQDQAWANPSSIHGAGQDARHALDQAKSAIARALGAKSHELIVTSGGTEANALALRQCPAGAPLALTAIEHSSLLRAAPQALRIPVQADGSPVVEAIPTDAALVAFQLANNETGTLNDVPSVAARIRARAPQALLLLDACQGAGKTPLDLGRSGVDLASIAGHKFGAPKGIGLLWARGGRRIEPLLRGGRQQMDRRSGTEDAALVSALRAALDEALMHLPSEDARQRQLLDACFARIRARLPAAQWIAQAAPRLGNTLSLGLAVDRPCSNEALVQRLDLRGFAVSVGAACMAGRGEPSHVIAALGIAPAIARTVIRVSIGHRTTATDLASFAEAYVDEALALLQAHAGQQPAS